MSKGISFCCIRWNDSLSLIEHNRLTSEYNNTISKHHNLQGRLNWETTQLAKDLFIVLLSRLSPLEWVLWLSGVLNPGIPSPKSSPQALLLILLQSTLGMGAAVPTDHKDIKNNTNWEVGKVPGESPGNCKADRGLPVSESMHQKLPSYLAAPLPGIWKKEEDN